MRERNESSKSEIKDKTRERKVLKSIILSEIYDEQQEITKRERERNKRMATQTTKEKICFGSFFNCTRKKTRRKEINPID